MHQGGLRQCEIFEILRIEISLERACLELSVVVGQSYQDSKRSNIVNCISIKSQLKVMNEYLPGLGYESGLYDPFLIVSLFIHF